MSLTIASVRPGASVQGLGRYGLAALGVAPGGAADRRALRLANRLVGNPQDAMAVEVTLGGLGLIANERTVVAVTGAPAPLGIEGRPAPFATPLTLDNGDHLTVGDPSAGVYSYVAVRGGIAPATRFETAALTPGTLLRPAGMPTTMAAPADVAAAASPATEVTLRVVAGPRGDWFGSDALATLCSAAWSVDSASNRVGVRLNGPSLARQAGDELLSEGTVRGSVQVPPDGQPVILFADHPVTGGYPVVAVVIDDDVDDLAQIRPGGTVRFVTRPAPWR